MVSWTYWWICWAHYFTGWNKNWLQRWNKIFTLSRRITEAAWRESKIIGLEWTFLVNSGVSWVLWKVDAESESGAQKSDWKVTLVKGEGRKRKQTDMVLRLYLGHMMPLLWMTQIIKEQIFLAALQDSAEYRLHFRGGFHWADEVKPRHYCAAQSLAGATLQRAWSWFKS